MLEIMIVTALSRDLYPQHLRARIVLIAALVPLAFVVCAAHPGPANAGGVHFDPESPAGKEYALPLAQARNEGAGKTGIGKQGSAEPAPLFGEGVSGPGGGGPEGAGQASGEGQRSAGHGAGGVHQATPPHTDTGGGSGPATLAQDGSDGYPTSTGVLLVAAIVLVGAALGFGLRRVGHARPS